MPFQAMPDAKAALWKSGGRARDGGGGAGRLAMPSMAREWRWPRIFCAGFESPAGRYRSGSLNPGARSLASCDPNHGQRYIKDAV